MDEGKHTVQLDDETDEVVGRLARERGADPATIVSQAVRLFDELYGKAGLDELNRRWADYEQTGESYSREEVEAWLETWGTRDFRPFRRRA